MPKPKTKQYKVLQPLKFEGSSKVLSPGPKGNPTIIEATPEAAAPFVSREPPALEEVAGDMPKTTNS